MFFFEIDECDNHNNPRKVPSFPFNGSAIVPSPSGEGGRRPDEVGRIRGWGVRGQ